MKRCIIAAIPLALILLITACGKYTCVNPGMQVRFSGFDTSELSNILVEQYTSGGTFTTQIGVSSYDTANTYTRQSNDTLYLTKVDTGGISIAPGYDYIVKIPATGSIYKISKISYTPVKKAAATKGGCTNDATYSLDTIAHKVAGVVSTEAKLPPVRIVLKK